MILYNQNLRNSYRPFSIVTTMKSSRMLLEDTKHICNWGGEFKTSGNREWTPGKQTMKMRSVWQGSSTMTDLDHTKLLLAVLDFQFQTAPCTLLRSYRHFCYSLISQTYSILYRSHTHLWRTGKLHNRPICKRVNVKGENRRSENGTKVFRKCSPGKSEKVFNFSASVNKGILCKGYTENAVV
jgi:hypothetical protein